jgi:hypothetical protein
MEPHDFTHHIQSDERVDETVLAGSHRPEAGVEDDNVAPTELGQRLAASHATVTVCEVPKIRIEVHVQRDQV